MGRSLFTIVLNDEKWVLFLLFRYMLHSEQTAPHRRPVSVWCCSIRGCNLVMILRNDTILQQHSSLPSIAHELCQSRFVNTLSNLSWIMLVQLALDVLGWGQLGEFWVITNILIDSLQAVSGTRKYFAVSLHCSQWNWMFFWDSHFWWLNAFKKGEADWKITSFHWNTLPDAVPMFEKVKIECPRT